MGLSPTQRVQLKAALRFAGDSYVRMPLWDFHPYYRPYVISERRRRGFHDLLPPDEIDPVYA